MIFWVLLIRVLKFTLSPYLSQKNIPILIFQNTRSFFTGFWTQSLKKAAPNQSWANSRPAGGTSSPEDHQQAFQAPSFVGLLQFAAECWDPKVGSSSNCLSECETYLNNSLILTVSSRCNRVFLFIISYIKCNTRIFVWIQTLKSSTWLLSFSNASSNQVIVTVQWLVATSNSKPVKDAGMAKMLNLPSTLLYLQFLCPKLGMWQQGLSQAVAMPWKLSVIKKNPILNPSQIEQIMLF